MNVWRSLAESVRVALAIAAGLEVVVLLGELLYAVWRALDPETLLPFFLTLHLPPQLRYQLCDALPRASDILVFCPVFAMSALGIALIVYLIWANWRNPVRSPSDLDAARRAFGQWLAIALLGHGTTMVVFRICVPSGWPSWLFDSIAFLGAFGAGAGGIALLSAILLAFDLLSAGLLRRSTALTLLALAVATFGAGLVLEGPVAVDLVFSLVVYLVAQRVIQRRLAQVAAAPENV